MTFYEAAIEVLRDEGRPLHFKKITAHAIKRNLLSHVGRTPEDTMDERLTQESQKPEDDSLIRSVRPGVFTLVEGADIEEARQTVTLREGNAESERMQSDSTAVAKNILDQQNSECSGDSSPSDSSRNDNRSQNNRGSSDRQLSNDNRSQNRSRNGSQRDSQSNRSSNNQQSNNDNRSQSRSQNSRGSDDQQSNNDNRSQSRSQNNRGSGDQQSNNDHRSQSHSHNNPGSDDQQSNNDSRSQGRSQNNRGSNDRQSGNDNRSQSRSQNNRGSNDRQSGNDNRSQPSKNPIGAESSSRMGDIAEHVAGLMANNGAMTLDDIARSMKNTTWASIEEFGSVAIRNILIHANDASGDAGQPPRFFELNNHRWTLAQASDKELGDSYDALNAWQSNHRQLLLDRLSQQLLGMSPGKLTFTVGLIMERLGYEQITDGKKIGDEIVNLVGNMDQGFANERTVIRVLARGNEANEQAVLSFRGSLNVYRADRGILISLDGFDGATDQHKRVDNVAPISLVTAHEVARLMLKTNVGVCHYEVSTACMDDAFFAS